MIAFMAPTKKHLFHFGDLIVNHRTRIGWSQYKLAVKSGISRQTLSKLELDGVNPNWDTVQRLVRALASAIDGFSYKDLADPALHVPIELETRTKAPSRRRRRRKQNG